MLFTKLKFARNLKEIKRRFNLLMRWLEKPAEGQELAMQFIVMALIAILGGIAILSCILLLIVIF